MCICVPLFVDGFYLTQIALLLGRWDGDLFITGPYPSPVHWQKNFPLITEGGKREHCSVRLILFHKGEITKTKSQQQIDDYI